MGIPGETEGVQAEALLLSVVEHLKAPLMSIARQAELEQLTGDAGLVDAAAIRSQAMAALSLVDSYLMGLDFLGKDKRAKLQLEPVSVSSTLVDVAHELERFAKHYQVQLEVQVGGRFGPVMGHAGALRTALLSLGFALVEAQASQDVKGSRRVVMATHRTPSGVVTGVYGRYESLSARRWRNAFDLVGRARQPFPSLMSGSGAGLFVADAILRSMNSHLRVGRYMRQNGLAATLQPSSQLSFV